MSTARADAGARPAGTAAMIVRCPACASRYLLPERLMGPGGARVTCPGCGRRFEVARPALHSAPEDPGPAAGPPDSGASSSVGRGITAAGPERLAREVVERLARREPALAEFHARGRLFAEAGRALLDAFDEYRGHAGSAADAKAFRAALRERWGIELGPAGED